MTKTIILSGGPDDGRVIKTSKGNTIYRIIEGAKIKSGKATLSGRTGTYQQTGEYQNLKEIFLWKGWAT